MFLQISVWNAEGWEKQFGRYVQIPDWEEPVKMLPCSYTRVQFYPNEKRFLAVQVRQLAIYEAEGLDCVKQVQSLSFSLQPSVCVCTHVCGAFWRILTQNNSV